MRFDRHL